MKKQLLIIPLAAVVFSGPRPAQGQTQEPARKITIEVTTTENGETTHVKRELDANDEQAVQDAFRELGIMDEMMLDAEDGVVTIDIRRMMKDAEDATEMAMKMTHGLNGSGKHSRGYLGVHMRALEKVDGDGKKTVDDEGASITEVVDGSPAQAAGLEKGDLIIKVGDHTITGPDDLSDHIGEKEPGTSVKVTYIRSGKKKTANIELGERPHRAFAYSHAMMPEQDIDRIMEFSAEPRAFLGVTPAEEPSDGGGAAIGNVEKGTSAERMGILSGDVIKNINGTDVADFGALRNTIRELGPGTEITVILERGSEQLTLQGKLGERTNDRFVFRDMDNGDERMWKEFHFEGSDDMEMTELKKELEALRAELDELQKELDKEVRREVRITMDSRTLTKSEKDLLTSKGVKGLDERLDLKELSISPNPSSGVFKLRFNAAERGDLKIMVHDATGELVHQDVLRNFSGNYDGSVDLSSRSRGAYFLIIQQNGRSATSKLIRE